MEGKGMGGAFGCDQQSREVEVGVHQAQATGDISSLDETQATGDISSLDETPQDPAVPRP